MTNSLNPYRDRDTPIAQMLGMSVTGWYKRLSPDERRMYRNIWSKTPEQDRQLPPGEWQLKYLGFMFIPPPPPKGPEYLSDRYGNTLVRYPDGTEEITLWREKVTITTHPSGEREIVVEDKGCKWSQIDHPSGKRIQRRSDFLPGRYIQQTEQPNGIIITSTYDGRLLREYPCGVRIIETADGRVEMQKGDELTELAPSVPAWKDVQRNRRAQFTKKSGGGK